MTPYELGFSALVDLEGDHFTGREALRRARAHEPRHILATVAIDWHEPLSFNAIRDASGLAGLATSIVFSPALGCNLAMAIFRPRAISSSAVLHVDAEIREELSLRLVRAPARIIAGAALMLPARHLVPAPLKPQK